jgi:deoxyadenosine/deoxycytidine kinase
MKKLKKSSKNNSLFNVVIIYGTVAVGKLTVANELYKLINYKFFHNHHTHDLARHLFERNDFHLDRIIENTRLLILKEISEAKINVITTHTYSRDFVSKTGLADPVYMKKIESIIEKNGGRACFVHLIADEKEILKRVLSESRKNYKKLRDKKILKEYLNKNDYKTMAPVKNNIQIDNTNISAKKVAKIIKKYFKL